MTGVTFHRDGIWLYLDDGSLLQKPDAVTGSHLGLIGVGLWLRYTADGWRREDRRRRG